MRLSAPYGPMWKKGPFRGLCVWEYVWQCACVYVSEREIEGERARVCVFVRMNVCTTVWSAQSEAVKTKTSWEKREKKSLHRSSDVNYYPFSSDSHTHTCVFTALPFSSLINYNIFLFFLFRISYIRNYQNECVFFLLNSNDRFLFFSNYYFLFSNCVLPLSWGIELRGEGYCFLKLVKIITLIFSPVITFFSPLVFHLSFFLFFVCRLFCLIAVNLEAVVMTSEVNELLLTITHSLAQPHTCVTKHKLSSEHNKYI